MIGKNEDSFLDLEENENNDLADKLNNERKKNAHFDRQEEIEILKEVEEMDEALTLDEKKFLIYEMNQLRNLIINSLNKDKLAKEKIDTKRYSIYKVVNNFFVTWITKDLSMKVVAPEKYYNKLKKLVKIQSYRVLLERNLKILEKKLIVPYIEK